MKRLVCLILVSMLAISFVGCDDEKDTGDIETTPYETDVKISPEETQAEIKTSESEADIDLTAMSSTMVYSEVSQMTTDPTSYMEKKIKMNGKLSVYHDDSTNKTYYACIIADATACCSQGIEFELAEGEYPAEGTEITVLGTFTTYIEGQYKYCQLKDAVLES